MSEADEKPRGALPVACSCLGDLLADLPPEVRVRLKPRTGNLRLVTCPGCGLRAWTNRSTDLCPDCEKEGVTNV
jgi:hypothetical protein